jgi:hypothetical protein
MERAIADETHRPTISDFHGALAPLIEIPELGGIRFELDAERKIRQDRAFTILDFRAGKRENPACAAEVTQAGFRNRDSSQLDQARSKRSASITCAHAVAKSVANLAPASSAA